MSDPTPRSLAGGSVPGQPREQFCYSFDGEHFEGCAESRELALDEAFGDGREIVEGMTIHLGVAVPYDAQIDGSGVLDGLRNDASEACGEFSDGWLDGVTSEAEHELTLALTQAFEAWATKHQQHPPFFTIKDVTEHVVTPEEFAQHG